MHNMWALGSDEETPLSTGLMDVSCSLAQGWLGVRRTFPSQSGKHGHEDSFLLFLSPPTTASGLADLLNHSGHHKKASGHGDHSCFLLVKHRLLSWEWKCFSLIETFGLNIWVPLLNVKAWDKQRSHWMILWCSSECLGGSRGRTAFALLKGR